jgi:hypothetical protein
LYNRQSKDIYFTMAKKLPQIDHDHQGQLLTLVGSDGLAVPEAIFPDEPEDKLLGRPSSYTVAYGPEGSWKDLRERSEQLQAALTAFAMRNQRVGFAVGSNDHRHNGPIFGRYRAGVPKVQDGAERNASDTYIDEAKLNFWNGSGFETLRKGEIRNREQLNARARIMWEKFFARFGTPVEDEDRKNYDRRDFYKRLGAVIEMTEQIKLETADRFNSAA